MKSVIIYSGKGGVGKSTTTYSLYKAAKEKGIKVAVLDADVNTPSLHHIFEDKTNLYSPYKIFEGYVPSKVISSWFKEISNEITEKEYDLLLIDTPPSISETHYLLYELTGAVTCLLVTQPHLLSREDNTRVMRSLQERKMNIVGTLVNMCLEGYKPQEGELWSIPLMPTLDSLLPFKNHSETYLNCLDTLLKEAKHLKLSKKQNMFPRFDETITYENVVVYSDKRKKSISFVNLTTWDDVCYELLEEQSHLGQRDDFLSRNTAMKVERLCKAFYESDTAMFMVINAPSTEIPMLSGEIGCCTYDRSQTHYNIPCVQYLTDKGSVRLFPHEVMPINNKMLGEYLPDMVKVDENRFIPNLLTLEAIYDAYGERIMPSNYEEIYKTIAKL